MRWFPTLPPSSTTSSWETLVKSNICIFYFPCGVTFFSHHPALHVCRRSCCCVCTRSHSGGGSQGCLRFCTLARFLFKRDVRRVLLSTLETTQITTGRLQTSACTKTPPAESDVLLRFKSLCFCFSLGILIILFLPLWGFFYIFYFHFLIADILPRSQWCSRRRIQRDFPWCQTRGTNTPPWEGKLWFLHVKSNWNRLTWVICFFFF